MEEGLDIIMNESTQEEITCNCKGSIFFGISREQPSLELGLIGFLMSYISHRDKEIIDQLHKQALEKLKTCPVHWAESTLNPKNTK